MPVDAYAACPCGSGKKFKWCCQPFYHEIEKAYTSQANRQHETALRIMEELTVKHPANPAVWGHQAELLWENDRKEEAEKALQKALELNPDYAFAFALQGMLRHEEGEIPGALVLYRKAAEKLDPESHEHLGEVYTNIGNCEIQLNRPLAARAAWQISLRHEPQNERTRKLFEHYFGEQGLLPPIMRAERTFKSPPQSAERSRRQAWDQALAGVQGGKLAQAARAFEQLTTSDPRDAAAWFNLGLIRTWLGDNRGALDAFEAYVAEEPDENQAADAWAMTEVIRLGEDSPDQTDHVEHRAVHRILNPRAVGEFLTNDPRVQHLHETRGLLAGEIIDREMPAADENLAGFQLPKLAALMILGGESLVLSNEDAGQFDKARRIITEKLGPAVEEPALSRRPARVERAAQQVLSIRLPQGLKDDHAERLLKQHVEQWFEENWIQRPLKSLNGVAPVDAAGHPTLRKKLLGVIRSQESFVNARLPVPYDFDRLRRRLGLPAAKPVTDVPGGGEITSMSAAELAALDAPSLPNEDLEKAFHAALKIDARELAGKFAEALVSRPSQPERPDPYGFFHHLIQLAIDNDQPGEAIRWIEAGMKHDCETNEGRRQNDYQLRRAQIHVRSREPDLAHEWFGRVLQRLPSDLKVLGAAAEGMLTLGRSQQAAAFAEQGLTRARQKGDRDHAGYFEELLAAARKR